MSKRRTNDQIVRSKGGAEPGGSLDWMPPSAGQYLCKNSDDPLEDADEDEQIVSEALLKELVTEIIKKCGSKWCLYTKGKKNGKCRRLGTHPSKKAAQNQEIAIKSHGG